MVALENLIDDDRQENAFGLMMSLNMLIQNANTFDYTSADFWSWCQEAGFKRYEVGYLAGTCSAAIAYKYIPCEPYTNQLVYNTINYQVRMEMQEEF